MNQSLFFFFNQWAGWSLSLDRAIVFTADYLGFAVFLFFICYECIFFARGEKSRVLFVLLGIGTASGAWIGAHILKKIIEYPRPFLALDGVQQLIAHGGYDSFPSGHAAFFFTLGMFLIGKFPRWGLVFVGVAVLISVARVAAGIHWPLDIVGGFSVALTTVLVAKGVKKRYSLRT